jgi:hypothetical protein
MTADECIARAAIADTLAICGQAGDARKTEAYVACFAKDGVLDLGDDGKIVGREALRAWMNAPSAFPQPDGAPPGFVSHHLTTCRITLTSDTTATARTYWMVTTAIGLDHNGYYDDFFAKDGELWLLTYRRIRTLWKSPQSVTHKR